MIAALLLMTAAVPARHHATGTFAVSITPEAQVPGSDRAPPTSRVGLHKTFSGALTAEASGTMLAAGTPAPGHSAAYVALDVVTGTLEGRRGSFVLVHRGTISATGAMDLQVTIAPDSGTGQLVGIAGSLTIEESAGQHRYDLAYTLPAAH